MVSAVVVPIGKVSVMKSDDSDNESFGDDFQDYDDYVGSES